MSASELWQELIEERGGARGFVHFPIARDFEGDLLNLSAREDARRVAHGSS